MKKVLAMIVFALLVTGCYTKESNKDYEKPEDSNARRY